VKLALIRECLHAGQGNRWRSSSEEDDGANQEDGHTGTDHQPPVAQGSGRCQPTLFSLGKLGIDGLLASGT
jgi:hypothetical protein